MWGSRPGSQTQTWSGCILERIHQCLCRGTPSLCCRRKSLQDSEQDPPSHGHKLYHLDWEENQILPVCTTHLVELFIHFHTQKQSRPSEKATSLSWPNPIDPSESHRVLLDSKNIWVFRLNSTATGSLTYKYIHHEKSEFSLVKFSFNLCSLTCWNLISRSNVIGSLGLQIGGTLYSIFWAAVQGISFTVYVPE